MAEISVADEGLTAAPRRERWPHRIAEAFAAEDGRRILWLPVIFGSGIALYFALTVEPPVWLGPGIALAAGSTALVGRRLPAWRAAALCLAVGAAGFALIAETARERAAPMLDHRLGPVAVTGRVIDLDTMERGWRITSRPTRCPASTPRGSPAGCVSTSPRPATC